MEWNDSEFGLQNLNSHGGLITPQPFFYMPGPTPPIRIYFPCSAGLMPHPPMYGKAERSIWIVSISPARGVSSTQCPVPASSPLDSVV